MQRSFIRCGQSLLQFDCESVWTHLRVHLNKFGERKKEERGQLIVNENFSKENIYIGWYTRYAFNSRWNIIITRIVFESNLYATGNKFVKIVASQKRMEIQSSNESLLRRNTNKYPTGFSNPKVKFCREGMIDLGTREKPFKLSRELGQTLNVHPRVLVRKEIEQILRSVIN